MASSQTYSTEQILNAPVAEPPPNIIQNVTDPPNNNKLALAVIATSVVLSTAFSLLRLYSRVFCAGKVRLEDYLGLLGFAFYIAGVGMAARMTTDAGLFVHLWNLNWRNFEFFVYDYVVILILWCFAFLFFRAAIILEWTHIFIPRATRNMFYWVCYVLLTANACLYMATVIALNLVCTPRERLWRRWIQGSCQNIETFNLSVIAIHLVFDIILLLLPHAVIWKLSMSKRVKLGVSVVFSVGVFLCACAVGRVASAIGMILREDKSWAYSQHLMWGLGEGTSTILVFCAPAFPIIFNGNRSYRSAKLKASPGWSPGHLKRRSDHHQRPWPQLASNNLAVDEYHRMHEESATHLATFRQSNSRQGSMQHRSQDEIPLHSYLGILKTTDIEITTHTETDLPLTSNRDEGFRHPWVDVRASS